ncbi:hypothetical protein B0H12DRAFT_294845 [Mycena haematopus]|nr:hypothetical protein B0H12DRAFT_294845 [Mycena haematopus]
MQPNMHSNMQSGLQSGTPYHQRWMSYLGPPAPGGYHPPYSPLVRLNRTPPQTIPPSPSLHGPPQILPRSPSLHAPPHTLPISVQLPSMPPRAPSVQPLAVRPTTGYAAIRAASTQAAVRPPLAFY